MIRYISLDETPYCEHIINFCDWEIPEGAVYIGDNYTLYDDIRFGRSKWFNNYSSVELYEIALTDNNLINGQLSELKNKTVWFFEEDGPSHAKVLYDLNKNHKLYDEFQSITIQGMKFVQKKLSEYDIKKVQNEGS